MENLQASTHKTVSVTRGHEHKDTQSLLLLLSNRTPCLLPPLEKYLTAFQQSQVSFYTSASLS